VGLGWDRAFGNVGESGVIDEKRKGWVEIDNRWAIPGLRAFLESVSEPLTGMPFLQLGSRSNSLFDVGLWLSCKICMGKDQQQSVSCIYR
jgi:hypothetical protein